MKNIRRAIGYFMICAGMLCVLFLFYFLAKERIKEKRDLEHLVEDDFSFVFQIDSISRMKDKVILDGWVFALKRNSQSADMEILLYEIDKGDIIYPKTEETERVDVNQYFLCEYDYSKSGFQSGFQISEKNMKNGIYEILVADRGKRKVYHTGTYVYNDELMYVNPNEFVPLEVNGTELALVVEEGILRMYRPDVGMYIYQYGGELYWIADFEYEFKADGNNRIEYQINTTQVQNLPKDRLDNGWHWSNIGFVFEENEIVMDDSWRVAKCRLPEEYSITDIGSGHKINDWVWQHNFRPWYEFK